MLLTELTPEVLTNFGFVPSKTNRPLEPANTVYWRGETLRFWVRPNPDERGNIAHLEGFAKAQRAGPDWTITFTLETPMPLVTAAIRRASDYMDVMVS
jgi:hypothetical protein